MPDTSTQTGTVVAGHGVASGISGDPRFPGGTLGLQFPIFMALGVELAGLTPATINVWLDGPLDLGEPDHVLLDVSWHDEVPPEDFSFWRIWFEHATWRGAATVYRPHPETKPDHHQPADVIEVLAPHIPGLGYGDWIRIVAGPTAR